MTTSSEDVLLQMTGVRYKKGDGTLYVMNERLAWMAEHRDTVTVSHRFSDIKTQKISPEGKPKVQLQVVLHDGNSSTFQFVNPNGQQAMVADRDKVKKLLLELLPNFKRKVDKELEEKNRLLSENPNLLQMYKDLVITQVLTSEEFWEVHAKDPAFKKVVKKQEIGVSGAFLADIKPQTDGCNGLKYNLTADIIHCIFKTYPAVKRKFTENVPTKLSEAEFWTKFFQSHYFHRDRLIAGTKDIFTECGKIDDQALKAAVQKGPDDPLLDLKRFDDVPLDEGYCSVSGDSNKINSGNIVHQNMIKRFNQHSIMVLNTCTGMLDMNIDLKGRPTTNGKDEKAETISSASTEATGPVAKRMRIIDKIRYDDLGGPYDDPDGEGAQNSQKLNITKVERYLHGPTPITYNDMHEDPRRMDEVQYEVMRQAETWDKRVQARSVLSPTSAVNALGDLSPGGGMMRCYQEQSVGQLVPTEFEKELKHLYLSLNNLLKQFWPCVPPMTPEQEEKVERMHGALQRFQMVKLVPFESRAMRELSPLGSSLLQHMNRLIQGASSKYATWQERQMRMQR